MKITQQENFPKADKNLGNYCAYIYDENQPINEAKIHRDRTVQEAWWERLSPDVREDILNRSIEMMPKDESYGFKKLAYVTISGSAPGDIHFEFDNDMIYSVATITQMLIMASAVKNQLEWQ